MKYIDLIAYPLMIGVVYVLIGMAVWDHDPANWKEVDRDLWLVWGLAWGWAMQRRITRGGSYD